MSLSRKEPWQERGGRPSSALSLVALLLISAVLTTPAVSLAQTDRGVIITPYSPNSIRITYQPPSTYDVLDPQDEVALARSVSLLRTGRVQEGLDDLQELLELYPASPRLISATASAWTNLRKPKQALKVLDKGSREIRRRGKDFEDAAEPYPNPSFAVERSEAYLAMGKYDKAIPWMVEAADLNAGNSQHLRAQLIEWASDPKLGKKVTRVAGERSDEFPARFPLAMLASELAALSGDWESVWPRLNRAEELGLDGRKGELVRALGHRLSVRPGIPPEAAAQVWLHMIGGPYDPTLRYEGMQQLLSATGLRASQSNRLRADYVEVDELYVAWQSLPAGPQGVQLGMDLTTYLRKRGAWEQAQILGNELISMDLPEGLQAKIEFEQGLAALHSGDLATAEARLLTAKKRDIPLPRVEAEIFYGLAETYFYAGKFAEALALYNEFSNEYPTDAHTNDALERIYLLESGSPLGGGFQDAPGLLSLAGGLYAERRDVWEEAAGYARTAEAEARLGEDSEGSVRAHAFLLLSRAEELRGFLPAALEAALFVADSLAENRLAPVARQRAGDLYLGQGDIAMALEQYEELLATHPKSWVAPAVRRQVTELRWKGVQ